MANNKYFDFDLPQQLIDQIEEYKNDPNPLNADLYQDEIRSFQDFWMMNLREKKSLNISAENADDHNFSSRKLPAAFIFSVIFFISSI